MHFIGIGQSRRPPQNERPGHTEPGPFRRSEDRDQPDWTVWNSVKETCNTGDNQADIPSAIINRSSRSGEPLTSTAVTVQPMDEHARMYPAVNADALWIVVIRSGPKAVTAIVAKDSEKIINKADPVGFLKSNGLIGSSRLCPARPSSQRKKARQKIPSAKHIVV